FDPTGRGATRPSGSNVTPPPEDVQVPPCRARNMAPEGNPGQNTLNRRNIARQGGGIDGIDRKEDLHGGGRPGAGGGDPASRDDGGPRRIGVRRVRMPARREVRARERRGAVTGGQTCE